MASKIRLLVFCVLGKRISTSEDYWQKIITIKHPSMAGRDAEVKQTLTDADEVRESRSAPQVRLYYRQYSNLHLCVVVKHLNGSGFIVTTYFTDRIKEGITLWTKRHHAMDKIVIHWDTEGDTLNVWFDDPKLEHSCQETGDEVVLSKDAAGRVIGFEKLNYQVSQAQREAGTLPIELRVA